MFQYANQTTTRFFQEYISKGGKLLLEGKATHDFNGKDITSEWNKIADKAVATSFSIENVAKLGIPKNELVDGVANEEGSYTFTSSNSLQSDSPANFRFTYLGNTFTGTYKGLAAIKIDKKGSLQKLSATGFLELNKNGKPVLQLSKEADIFLMIKDGIKDITIADPTKSTQVISGF